MHMIGLAPQLAAPHALVDNLWIPTGRGKCWKQILVCEEIGVDGARFDNARPTNKSWDTVAALKVGGLFPAVWRAATVGPSHHLRAIVRGVGFNDVIRDSEIV